MGRAEPRSAIIIRTFAHALGDKYVVEFGEAHARTPCIEAHAPSLINLSTADANGKTAPERCRGRQSNE
eukprot:9133675-Pyramimonas_sp.AAC.1